ncbi:MAG: response regulator [Planctomycetes bacterium]|nr:response regulator [Planctomycetota bacterium]
MVEMASVLVVDDDPVVRLSVRRALAGQALDVEEASSGEAAMARLAQRDFDLVLLDLRMPRLGGLTVLQHLSKHRPATQIVVMTGHANVDNAKGSIQLGAFEFLSKPVEPAQLLEITQRALAGKGLKLQRR